MIFEWDDMGCNHIISDMCQSHDCRDRLLQLKEINPAFKCTLFAIPGEMTPDLLLWGQENKTWVEYASHGIFHGSNYECEKMSYEEFDKWMYAWRKSFDLFFTKGFRAPGWQISDDILRWLADHDWWVADQNYNTDRRPRNMKAYINNSGIFYALDGSQDVGDMATWDPVQAYHGHTWDVGEKGNAPNGIYEDAENVDKLVAEATDFQFISELFQ